MRARSKVLLPAVLGLLAALGLLPASAAAAPAAAKGTIVDGLARFQVLTPRLIRLEFAEDGRFENRPTMLGFERALRSRAYTTRVVRGQRVIRTSALTLRYRRGSGPFTADNLSITVRAGRRSVRAVPDWTPAPPPVVPAAAPLSKTDPDPDPSPVTSGNLGGWARSLDRNSGPRNLRDGLISRAGWHFVNDSANALVPGRGARLRPRPSRDRDYQDGYVFGYGRDFPAALGDLRALSGPAPLLPEKAFGVWFSRFAAYNELNYTDWLLPLFEEERVPLDVLVIDTDARPNFRWNGWDGWRPDRFPDPSRFLSELEDRGIDTAFNVHPSIAAADPRFGQAQATAGGLRGPIRTSASRVNGDPAQRYFGWDWRQSDDLRSFFDLHSTYERDGIDMFWLDWCCDDSIVDLQGISGDAWINMQYARRNAARGSRWPVLARMGASFQNPLDTRAGPWGEQRSTIHFTGDTFATWPMLDFQTRFTAAEGNVGLPYVSHDVGSYAARTLAPDLYVRWVQSGVFQPIFRIHSARALARRLPFEFEGRAREISGEFFRLRAALVPYLYTLAREAHDTGMPMVRGTYLRYPAFDAAYAFDRQYLLGDDVLVAPVGTPGDPARKRVWFPPGEWEDLFTGQRFRGPRARTLRVPMERMPVFVRAGGILPQHVEATNVEAAPENRLVLDVFAGAPGSFSLYEDAGDGLAHTKGAFARTPLSWDGGLEIGASAGRFRGMTARRSYEVRVHGVPKPAAVLVGARAIARGRWTHDRRTRTLTVRTGRLSTRSAVRMTFPRAQRRRVGGGRQG